MGTYRKIGERIRELRESIKPEPTQSAIGKALGHYQVWFSRRETDEVEFTVSEAIAAVEALGYAAELVILPYQHRELLGLLGQLNAEDTGLALRVLAAIPRIDLPTRKMLVGMAEGVEETAGKPIVSERV